MIGPDGKDYNLVFKHKELPDVVIHARRLMDSNYKYICPSSGIVVPITNYSLFKIYNADKKNKSKRGGTSFRKCKKIFTIQTQEKKLA